MQLEANCKYFLHLTLNCNGNIKKIKIVHIYKVYTGDIQTKAGDKQTVLLLKKGKLP